MFVIVLNGPSCAGKSTVAKILWKSTPQTAYVNLDKVKWLVSDHVPDHEHLALAGRVGVAMMREYLRSGYNVIVDNGFIREEYTKEYVDAAEDAEVFIFNIEAPLKEILKRYESREQKRDEKNPHRRKTLTRERAIELHNNYHEHLFDVDGTFDTALIPPEKIADKILSRTRRTR